jgi:rhomboid family GlyGly-CTERM serine protease
MKIITNQHRDEAAMKAMSWRQSLNCDGAYGWLLLGALALLLLCAAGGDRWLMVLRYEREAVAHGQWWRLVTAHFVHLGVKHLLLDGAALALLWALFARLMSARSWLLIVGGSGMAIDIGLWWFAPGVQWYAGISGLLHGVWAAGALQSVQRREITGGLLLLALVAKLAREQFVGASLVVASFPVVVEAHLYGALGALAVWTALVLSRKPL